MGYIGYSMSERAKDAYNSNKKPKSKWTKQNILNEVEKNYKEEELSFNMSEFKKLSVDALKSFLYCTEWHHTSSFYNSTDFYEIDYSKLEELTTEKMQEIEKVVKELKKENKKYIQEHNNSEKWEVEYLDWSGSRKHPKATAVKDVVEIKGDWAYLKYGNKKSIYANGFKKIRKIEEVIK